MKLNIINIGKLFDDEDYWTIQIIENNFKFIISPELSYLLNWTPTQFNKFMIENGFILKQYGLYIAYVCKDELTAQNTLNKIEPILIMEKLLWC